jgi:hypothetical protein
MRVIIAANLPEGDKERFDLVGCLFVLAAKNIELFEPACLQANFLSCIKMCTL